MHVILFLLMIAAIYARDIPAQRPNLIISIKTGFDNYNGSFGFFESTSDDYWNTGFIAEAEIEKPLSRTVSFQSAVSFSVHDFDTRYAWGEKVNNAKNYILNAGGNFKFNISFFYYRIGLGLYYLKEDEIYFTENNPFHSAFETLHHSKSEIGIMGILGSGFEFQISKRIILLIEMDANIRHYLGGSFFLGLRHTL